ncbi:hypothetical protein [Phormidium sp. CCY1219]|uniref:hypothetical protein n=1 Tax=Phormidium sp. CCY1219 TaxID=2886104 RepID=UPI002D1ED76D|nr:hypothetical protein [Phormidium sp. CCY1219]MEB3829670.1 hypothetical protein [Phormidium sp. CCY1219]
MSSCTVYLTPLNQLAAVSERHSAIKNSTVQLPKAIERAFGGLGTDENETEKWRESV